MKSFLSIIAVSLLLTACSTTKPIVTKPEFVYVPIPTTFFDCDTKRVARPNPATLTDKQIVDYMMRVDNLLVECQTDAGSVRAWDAELQKRYSELNSKG